MYFFKGAIYGVKTLFLLDWLMQRAVYYKLNKFLCCHFSNKRGLIYTIYSSENNEYTCESVYLKNGKKIKITISKYEFYTQAKYAYLLFYDHCNTLKIKDFVLRKREKNLEKS